MLKYFNFKLWLLGPYFRNKKDGCIYEPTYMLVMYNDDTLRYSFNEVNAVHGNYHSNRNFSKKEVLKYFVKLSYNESMAIDAKRSLLSEV